MKHFIELDMQPFDFVVKDGDWSHASIYAPMFRRFVGDDPLFAINVHRGLMPDEWAEHYRKLAYSRRRDDGMAMIWSRERPEVGPPHLADWLALERCRLDARNLRDDRIFDGHDVRVYVRPLEWAHRYHGTDHNGVTLRLHRVDIVL